MTQEEKELLIKDKTSYSVYEMIVRGVDVESKTVDVIDWGKVRFAAVRIEKIKPYLRPMSSMTEEERQEYGLILCDELSINQFDWLNRKMFDYRGLIPKGLALEAKEGMYN